MNEKIAASLNHTGTMVSLKQACQIALYQRTDDGWITKDKYPFQFPVSSAAIRLSIHALYDILTDCRIFVSKKVEGIAYQELNRLGFCIFESDFLCDALLDDIATDLEEAGKEQNTEVFKVPYSPLKDGHYFLDLVKLQQAYPDISSKKAFRAFLETESFLSFTLICAHIPPWVNELAVRRSLYITEEKMQSGIVKVVISPA